MSSYTKYHRAYYEKMRLDPVRWSAHCLKERERRRDRIQKKKSEPANQSSCMHPDTSPLPASCN